MNSLATLSFSIQPFEGVHAITPDVNGKSLVEVVSAFEREQRYDPVGGYGGLIPEWFNYGSLGRYFLGDFEPNSYFANMGGVYLLGCDCGEVGCWPLSAHIETEGDSVNQLSGPPSDNHIARNAITQPSAPSFSMLICIGKLSLPFAMSFL